MYAKLPLLLLLSAGLASVSTAFAPHHDARSINIVPRQNNNQRVGGNGRNGGGRNGGGRNGGGQNGGGNGQDGDDQNNGDNQNNALTLDPDNVQAASSQTGQEGGDDPAQADSLTDDANFINFCSGKTLTNGQQVTGGSCNGIVMGDIPSQGNMVSSIIISPAPGEDIAADTPFDITVQVANLAAGSFTNPQNTYYAAPQTLNGGKIVGHTHVTVQALGNSLTPNQPPDAATFAFFKGINDDGNGNGLLSANVAEGLPAGNYRVCTMSSASNHQPVLMPVAQRGAQDDCTKFTVGQGNGQGNGQDQGNDQDNGQDGDNGQDNGQDEDNGQDNGQDQEAGVPADPPAEETPPEDPPANGGGDQNQGGGQNGGGGGGRRRGGRGGRNRGGKRRGGRFGAGFKYRPRNARRAMMV